MKIKSIITNSILLFLFSCTNTASKETNLKMETDNYISYYKKCNEALESKVNGDITKAIQLYELAFSEHYPFVDDLNELKNCYVLLGKKSEAYLIIERMVLCGFKLKEKSYLISPNSAIVGKKNLQLESDSNLIDQLNLNYVSLRKEFLSSINYEKDKYLTTIASLDRFTGYMRTHSGEKDEAYIATVGFNALAQLFLNLMDSDQLPYRYESDAWDDQINLALIHIALSLEKHEEQERFLNKLKELVICGTFPPAQYAVIFDQIYERVRNNKESFYGMSFEAVFNFDDPSQLKLVITSPMDIDNVDKRRNEIFLPPLWVWAKQKGYQLPINYSYN